MRRESRAGGGRISFRGVALTGWSRYDHFAVLCELLPSSVPSLVLSLAVLAEGGHSEEAARKAGDVLSCTSAKAPMTQEELLRSPEQWDLHRCDFPGSDLFALLSSYALSRKEVESTHEKVTKRDGWMTDYTVRHRFSSVSRVTEVMRSASYLPSSLRSLEQQARDTLGRYFDKHTTEEWIEHHFW